MDLNTYNEKRDFNRTPEPFGRKSRDNLDRFVVQRHRASHLHYDLRLEIDGVLKSWAIPKGPSMNASVKRLAVQTEDHPLKYLDFHGTIPKGNYGAGEMTIWDKGIFKIYNISNGGNASEQFKKGNLKIELFGSKLKGKFALVKTSRAGKQPQWLLIKKADNFATELNYDAEVFHDRGTKKSTDKKVQKSLKINSPISPMLAENRDKIFSDPNFIYEIKWDGYRLLSNVLNGSVQLYSRNGISYVEKFPLLVHELSTVAHDVILDGEVVIVDEQGKPHFQRLQNYQTRKTKGRLMYYVFDLLHLNGHDTIGLPLIHRKSLLPDILNGLNHIAYCDHIDGMGIAFYERTINLGLEGVMAKKKHSLYYPGYRTDDWLKIKEFKSLDALICGYTTGSGRGKFFGSLILGQYIKGELIYIGNCGSGFDDAEQKRLHQELQSLFLSKSPFNKKINLKGREPHFVQPLLQCEIKFSDWTNSGVLRHPVYKGLKGMHQYAASDKKNKISNNRNSKGSSAESLKIDGTNVTLTNLDKVYWPGSGYTKYDLIDYYIYMADILLPYLKDRPQNLHRHPNGINSKGFYQKDFEAPPQWANTIPIYSKSAEREINYLLCNDAATLIYMANLGCIELNPWSSRIDNLEFPDYTVIDLDPSDKNSFDEVLDCARVAGAILKKANIPSYCKTTGKSGLHIYLPLNARYTYEEARTFTKLLCVLIHEKLPKLTSMERTVNKRKGKIYLDYLQNRRGQTLASVYCARPVDNALVSTPLSWAEIEKGITKEAFTIKTIPERVKIIGDLFKPILKEKIDMEKILSRLT